MLPIYVEGFRRVSKPAARKMFLAGKKVWVTTNDSSLESPWTHPIELTVELESERNSATFEKFVNSFTYYNCSSNRKQKPIFIVKEET